MGRIELDLSEYQGMRKKIKDLESALNSVSIEAASNKEKIEQAKAILEDLKVESLFKRVFNFKKILEPIDTLLNSKNEQAKS